MTNNEIIYSIFFYVIAFVLIVSALGIIFLPRIVYSAVAMITCFLAASGIFVLLNADFLAISQIIIYVTGITIVMIFAIMFTGINEDKKLGIALKFRSLIAFMAGGLIFLAVICSFTNTFSALSQNAGIFNITPPSAETVQRLKTEGTTPLIGKLLLTKYALPFEILSLLLLAAVIGAVVMTGKNEELLVNPTTKNNQEE